MNNEQRTPEVSAISAAKTDVDADAGADADADADAELSNKQHCPENVHHELLLLPCCVSPRSPDDVP